MGILPNSPHYAYVNFKLKTLDLTPIPPQHLISFAYTRQSNSGMGNEFTLTVHDQTAIAIEYALATNTAMAGVGSSLLSDSTANGTDAATPGGTNSGSNEGSVTFGEDGSVQSATLNGVASELSDSETTTVEGDDSLTSDDTDTSTGSSLPTASGYDCEFSYGYTDGAMSPTYSGQITEYDTDFDGNGVTLTITGTSLGLAQSMVTPESITYEKMLISDIVKNEADANGWYYTDETIEETEPVMESTTYTLSGGTTTGGTADGSTSGGSMTGTPGSSVSIPDQYGSGGYTVTCYDDINWDRNSDAGDIYYNYWVPSGMQFDNGIAVYDGCYLIACTPTFGKVGDKIQWTLEDGTIINTIMADTKNTGDAGCNQWGHNNGQCVLEFEVQASKFRETGTNPGSNGWMAQWGGKRVVSATNYGSILNGGTSTASYSTPQGDELRRYMKIVRFGPSLQEKLLDAMDSTPSVGMCQYGKWVSKVFNKAGFGYYRGEGSDVEKYCSYSGADPMLPGMIITCVPNGDSGSRYGVVGICYGDRMVAYDGGGTVAKVSLEDFVKRFSTYGRLDGGVPKWGWYRGHDLTV